MKFLDINISRYLVIVLRLPAFCFRLRRWPSRRPSPVPRRILESTILAGICRRPLPGALIDAQLAFMKTALKLTDAQLPAWNAVADTLREQAKGRDAEITSHRTAPETAAQPDDLIAHLQERQHTAVLEADNLAELLIALKPLYVVLSDDQKEIAGHLFPPGRRGDGPPPPDMDGPPHCPPLFRTESR